MGFEWNKCNSYFPKFFSIPQNHRKIRFEGPFVTTKAQNQNAVQENFYSNMFICKHA